MVYHRLDHVFGALADPTRRRMLQRLRRREHSISELAAPFRMSLPAVSKHLRVLERAGLISRHREGRQWNCRLVARPMQQAADWLDTYRAMWEQQFDRLAVYLELDSAQEDVPCSPPLPTLNSVSPASSRQPRSGSSKRGPLRKK